MFSTLQLHDKSTVRDFKKIKKHFFGSFLDLSGSAEILLLTKLIPILFYKLYKEVGEMAISNFGFLTLS
jgi:hypothetical protein